MSSLRLAPVNKGRKKSGECKKLIKENDPVEVISLDGDEDETNVKIEDDIEEVISDISENKNNPQNSLACTEVISLVDDDDDDDDDDEDSYSSDEDEEIPIGTAKLTFLDAANKKVHKFIQITNAEDESDDVNVEDVSSDSDVEEVIEKPDKDVYITIDPDDYKKVVNDTTKDVEHHKIVKRKNAIIPQNKKKVKINDTSGNNNFEVVEDFSSSLTNKKNPDAHELSESLKGPNIPKALCCHSCSFVSFKQEDLSLHIALKHPSKAESLRTYTAAEIQELEREMRDQADDCSSCGQALWYLPTLRAHAMIHPTGKIDCEACHHGTSVIKLLMDHLESHVGSEEEEEDSDI